MNSHKKLKETISLKDSISMRKESDYLIISNKEKCENLISQSDLDEKDIIDIFISLHIVLEVSLNTLFRHLSLISIKKDVDKFEVIKNLDNINFIDKTILFIYNSKFEFGDKIADAGKYHSIIGTMKDFATMRNQLLHGHSISTVFDGEHNRYSGLKENITLENLEKQIGKFRFILEGMRFYLYYLDSSLTQSGKESFTKAYLSDDFLPHLSILRDEI